MAVDSVEIAKQHTAQVEAPCNKKYRGNPAVLTAGCTCLLILVLQSSDYPVDERCAPTYIHTETLRLDARPRAHSVTKNMFLACHGLQWMWNAMCHTRPGATLDGAGAFKASFVSVQLRELIMANPAAITVVAIENY